MLILASLALLLAGCAAPQKLANTSEKRSLPVFDYVSADAVGWWLFSSKKIEELEGDEQDYFTASLAKRLLSKGDYASSVGPWIGAHAGIALSSISESNNQPYAFFMVAKKKRLESALADSGWRKSSTVSIKFRGESLPYWSRPMRIATAADASSSANFRSLVILPDAAIASTARADLESALKRIENNPASQLVSTLEHSNEALQKTAGAFVFRGDFARDEFRRTFVEDPTKLELSRWLTGMSFMKALRDGWIGFKTDDGVLRVSGKADWVPELYRFDRPSGLPPSTLEKQSADTALTVSFSGIGNVISDLLLSITQNNADNSLPTDSGDRLKPLLDEHNDAAALSIDDKAWQLHLNSEKQETLYVGVERALRASGLTGENVSENDQGVTVSSRSFKQSKKNIAESTQYQSLKNRLKRAPQQPFAWVYQAKSPCAASRTGTEPSLGWIAFSDKAQIEWDFLWAKNTSSSGRREASGICDHPGRFLTTLKGRN